MEGDGVEGGAAEELGETFGCCGPWGSWVYDAEICQEFGGGAGPFGAVVQEIGDGSGDLIGSRGPLGSWLACLGAEGSGFAGGVVRMRGERWSRWLGRQ